MTTAVVTKLSAHDRCDRCGAQAYVHVTFPTGGQLYFCAHHGRQHSPALLLNHAIIRDESARLLPALIDPSEDEE